MQQLLILLSLVALGHLNANPIESDYGTFYDEAREREVPYKVYYPEVLEAAHPVVIFSHGLGGSREGGAYLGEWLAEHGYITFHVQHIGTDQSIWEGKPRSEIMEAMREATRDPGAAQNRYKDIPFVVDELERLNEEDKRFAGRLDLEALGMMGHSYGGRSTLAAAGERIGRRYSSVKEPRIKAGLVLSPNAPSHRRWDPERAYKDIDIPLFHMTGTEDGDPLGRIPDFTPELRERPFKEISGPPQFLLVLDEADHATFGGRRLGKQTEREKDPQHIEVIRDAALHFFNAYLRDDEAALEYLKSDYVDTLNSLDRFDVKDIP